MVAKISYFREFRHLRRGMPKTKMRNININNYIQVEIQELNLENNQSSEFKEVRKGKSVGYVVWIWSFIKLSS